MKKILAIVLAGLMMAFTLAACGDKTASKAASGSTAASGSGAASGGEAAKPLEMVDVRIGIHGNVGGAPLAGVAIEQGFFEEEGINPIVTVVESGPVEMAAMRADNRTLDCGYIGAGVAWNAMDPNGNQLKFIFLDNLSNAEMMIARKGMFEDTNKNNFFDYDEIYAGLKGKTVYIEDRKSVV